MSASQCAGSAAILQLFMWDEVVLQCPSGSHYSTNDPLPLRVISGPTCQHIIIATDLSWGF